MSGTQDGNAVAERLWSAIRNRGLTKRTERQAFYVTLRERLSEAMGSNPAQLAVQLDRLEAAIDAVERGIETKRNHIVESNEVMSEQNGNKPAMSAQNPTRTGFIVVMLAAAGVVAAGASFWASQKGGDVANPIAAHSGGGIPSAKPESSDQAANEMPLEFSGVSAFTAPADNTIEATPEGTVVVRSRRVDASPSGRTNGAYATIASKNAMKLAGKTVEIIVTARKANKDSSTTLAVAYSTNSAGNSGWQDFELNANFTSFAFRYDVPSGAAEANNADYIGLWADKTGSGKGVEIQSLTLAVVDEAQSGS